MVPAQPYLCDMCYKRYEQHLSLKVEIKFVLETNGKDKTAVQPYCIHAFDKVSMTNLNLEWVEQEAKEKGLV